MSKNTALTSKALVIRHAKLSTLRRDAEREYSKIHNSVSDATVFIPELAKAGGIFALSQLDAHAAKYERDNGLTAGTAAWVHFRWRMDSYRRILADLEVLHQQWRRDSGVELAEQIQRDTYPQEQMAWAAIIARLKSGKDVAPITRYLAAEGKVLEDWKLRQAFKALSRKGVR